MSVWLLLVLSQVQERERIRQEESEYLRQRSIFLCILYFVHDTSSLLFFLSTVACNHTSVHKYFQIYISIPTNSIAILYITFCYTGKVLWSWKRWLSSAGMRRRHGIDNSSCWWMQSSREGKWLPWKNKNSWSKENGWLNHLINECSKSFSIKIMWLSQS